MTALHTDNEVKNVVPFPIILLQIQNKKAVKL